MIMKLKVPSAYWQISICAKRMTDFPDWDDDALEKGIVKTKEGLYVTAKNDRNITLSIQTRAPKSNFRYLDKVSLVSADGDYEIASPDTVNYGLVVNVEGGTFEFDIYVNSVDIYSITSVVLVSPVKISLVKSDFDSWIDRGE
jgi:hypothetical protein